MDTAEKAERLEAAIRDMTRPIKGKYPRPWMTSSRSPADAKVFTVGKSQRNPFPVDQVGSHEHYIHALFNRGPENCRQLYDRLVQRASPTRKNTDSFVQKLATHGVENVLETNVICYPMGNDLQLETHVGGAERGRELFRTILDIVQPTVLIAHGTETVNELGRLLNCKLPRPPAEPSDPVHVQCGDMTVFVIPSLGPPGFNKWVWWAEDHLEGVAEGVSRALRSS